MEEWAVRLKSCQALTSKEKNWGLRLVQATLQAVPANRQRFSLETGSGCVLERQSQGHLFPVWVAVWVWQAALLASLGTAELGGTSTAPALPYFPGVHEWSCQMSSICITGSCPRGNCLSSDCLQSHQLNSVTGWAMQCPSDAFFHSFLHSSRRVSAYNMHLGAWRGRQDWSHMLCQGLLPCTNACWHEQDCFSQSHISQNSAPQPVCAR